MAEQTPVRRPPPKPSFQRTLMYMLGFLTLFVLLDGDLRNGLGLALAGAFDPTIGLGGAFPLVTLLLAACFTTLVSSLARHLSTNWVRMTKVNRKMQALQKARMDAMRRGNSGKVEKLQKLAADIRMESAEVQMAQLKPLLFTFLPFILFWAWLSRWFGVEVLGQGRVFIAIPWAFQTNLTAAYVMPVWFLLYFVFTFLMGQVFTRLFKLLSFRKHLAALEAQGGAG